MNNCATCGQEIELVKLRVRLGKNYCANCLNSFRSRRIGAQLIDQGVLFGLIALSHIPFPRPWETPEHSLSLDLINVYATILYLFKDGIGGRSIGKRFMNIQVIDAETGDPGGMMQSFKRNLPLLIVFVQLFALFKLTKDQRTGEGWAHTHVIDVRH